MEGKSLLRERERKRERGMRLFTTKAKGSSEGWGMGFLLPLISTRSRPNSSLLLQPSVLSSSSSPSFSSLYPPSNPPPPSLTSLLADNYLQIPHFYTNPTKGSHNLHLGTTFSLAIHITNLKLQQPQLRMLCKEWALCIEEAQRP